jgi:hypothetical protein
MTSQEQSYDAELQKQVRNYEEHGIVAEVGDKSFVFTNEDIVAIAGSVTLVCASKKEAYYEVHSYWRGQGVDVECVEELDTLLLLTYHDGRDKPLAFLDMENRLPLRLVYLLLHQEQLNCLKLAVYIREYYKTLLRSQRAIYDQIEEDDPWRKFETFVRKITNRTHNKITIYDDALSVNSGHSAFSASAVPNMATNTSKTKTKKNILANKKRIANFLKVKIALLDEIPFEQISTMCLHMRQVCKMEMSDMLKCMWNWDIFNGILMFAKINMKNKIPNFFGIIPVNYSKMLFIPSIRDTDLYVRDAAYRRSLNQDKPKRPESTWAEVSVELSDVIIAQVYVTLKSGRKEKRERSLYKLEHANVGVTTYGEYIDLLGTIPSPGKVKDYIGKYLGTMIEHPPIVPSQEDTAAANILADLNALASDFSLLNDDDFPHQPESYATPTSQQRDTFELDNLCEPPTKKLKPATKDMDRVAAVTAETSAELELEEATSTRVVDFTIVPEQSEQPTYHFELRKTLTLQRAYSILDAQAQASSLFVPDNAVNLAETLINKKFNSGFELINYIFANSFLRNTTKIRSNIVTIANKYFEDPLCKIFIARACGLDIGSYLIKRS